MDITMDVNVVCAVCGKILSGEMSRSGALQIDPCEECLTEAYKEGDQESEGRKEK